MSQPIWKTLQSLGDRGLILEDVTGVYPPEAEVWEEYEKEDDGEVELDDDGEEISRNRTYVYSFSLDRCDMLPSGALVPHGFVARDDLPFGISHYEEWFSKYLADVARSVGQTREELAAAFCSADPCERFWAYEAVAGYHGFHEFDNYPLDLSEKEMNEREDMHRTPWLPCHSRPTSRQRKSRIVVPRERTFSSIFIPIRAVIPTGTAMYGKSIGTMIVPGVQPKAIRLPMNNEWISMMSASSNSIACRKKSCGAMNEIVSTVLPTTVLRSGFVKRPSCRLALRSLAVSENGRRERDEHTLRAMGVRGRREKYPVGV